MAHVVRIEGGEYLRLHAGNRRATGGEQAGIGLLGRNEVQLLNADALEVLTDVFVERLAVLEVAGEVGRPADEFPVFGAFNLSMRVRLFYY